MENKEKYKAQYKYKQRNIDSVKAYNKVYSRKTRHRIPYRWTRLKARCKRLGRKFRISLAKYTEMIKAGCYYCGASLMNAKGGNLDRVNNLNYNYTTQNVVACCTNCNDLKNYQLSKDETLYVVKQLKKFRKKHKPKKTISPQERRAMKEKLNGE